MSLARFATLVLTLIMYVLFAPTWIQILSQSAGSGLEYYFVQLAPWGVFLALVYYTWRSLQVNFVPRRDRRRGAR